MCSWLSTGRILILAAVVLKTLQGSLFCAVGRAFPVANDGFLPLAPKSLEEIVGTEAAVFLN